jgi:hypothetical protein
MTAGDVRLMGSMLGWRIALPALKRLLPLPRLVRLMARDGGPDGTEPERVSAITTAARRLFRPRIPGADNCLERSLLIYRYLLRDGARPELVCGVERTGDGIEGHAWVQLDGRPVSDSPEAVERFAPIVRFGPDGER